MPPDEPPDPAPPPPPPSAPSPLPPPDDDEEEDEVMIGTRAASSRRIEPTWPPFAASMSAVEPSSVDCASIDGSSGVSASARGGGERHDSGADARRDGGTIVA